MGDRETSQRQNNIDWLSVCLPHALQLTCVQKPTGMQPHEIRKLMKRKLMQETIMSIGNLKKRKSLQAVSRQTPAGQVPLGQVPPKTPALPNIRPSPQLTVSFHTFAH